MKEKFPIFPFERRKTVVTKQSNKKIIKKIHVSFQKEMISYVFVVFFYIFSFYSLFFFLLRQKFFFFRDLLQNIFLFVFLFFNHKIGCCVFFSFWLVLDAKKREKKNWTTLFVMKIVHFFKSNNYQFCAVLGFYLCCGIFVIFVLKFFIIIYKDSFILLKLH